MNVLALYYRNFQSFNIYLNGILIQIFSSKRSLEFQTVFFLSNPYKIYFGKSLEDMATMATKF